MQVAWAEDKVDAPGGAELSAEALRQACPHEIVPVEQADLICVGNCVTARVEDLPKDTPIIKRVADMWPHGDPGVRDFILSEAALLIFSSPLHVEHFPYDFAAPHAICPAPVNTKRQGKNDKERQGTCWLGSMDFWGGGIEAALEWAAANDEPIDFYGDGPFAPTESSLARPQGRLSYEQVPEVLERYKRFVWLPQVPVPYTRSLIEAWTAGCELITNENCGALWWLRNDREALQDPASHFWRLIEEAL